MRREGIYLAREIISPEPEFYIRQSYNSGTAAFPFHRNIAHIGRNPADHLVYIGDSGYYIHEDLVDAVQPYVEGDPEEILEDLLWPFVRKDIQSRLERFRGRSASARTPDLTEEERSVIEKEVHVFDRRRLHYFWYGSIDQSRLYQMPLKLCRRLSGMSRDQKEQHFIEREKILAVDEIKQYLYTVFNLQQYFAETISRIMPQGLDREKMDEYFVRELCSLNSDPTFWTGMKRNEDLPPYLVRYLIRFFDTEFGRSSALDDYIRQFIDSRRQHRFPEKKSRMNVAEASGIFAESPEKMQGLDKSELTRLFRQKAKELHPDTGGEHRDFIRLVEAYERLLKMKK